jgi:DNA primase large subunit
VLTKEDLAKYPFAPEAQAFVKERGLTAEELDKTENRRILERAVGRLKESLESGIVSARLEEVEVEVLSYPAAMLLASLTNDRLLQSRYAEGEAKRAFTLLKDETVDKLAYIAHDCFDWAVERVSLDIGPRSYGLALRWRDFLSVSMGFKSHHWKLVNRTLSAGLVYLQRHELARLMAEALRERLLSRLSTAPTVELREGLKASLREVLELSKRRAASSVGLGPPKEGGESAYPPCIKALLEDASAGRQLPHMARFTLASFMLNVGKTVEEVVDLFRRLPDFDEKRTTYHVRHVAGEIGSRTKYTPPRCETLRTFNLCPSPDRLCQRVKHPLAYYRLRSMEGSEAG